MRTDLHQHYNALPAHMRGYVDEAFQEASTALRDFGITPMPDDKAERVVDAISRYIIESYQHRAIDWKLRAETEELIENAKLTEEQLDVERDTYRAAFEALDHIYNVTREKRADCTVCFAPIYSAPVEGKDGQLYCSARCKIIDAAPERQLALMRDLLRRSIMMKVDAMQRAGAEADLATLKLVMIVDAARHPDDLPEQLDRLDIDQIAHEETEEIERCQRDYGRELTLTEMEMQLEGEDADAHIFGGA